MSDFKPTKLELDVLSIGARLDQLDEMDPESEMADHLWVRVMTCDVPRLLEYVSVQAIEWAELDGADLAVTTGGMAVGEDRPPLCDIPPEALPATPGSGADL